MTRLLSAAMAAASLIAASCSSQSADPGSRENSQTATGQPDMAQSSAASGGQWQMLSSGEGVALLLGDPARPTVRLYCEASSGQLLVNVPGFKPIGSEERMSIGSGQNVVALVADPSGDSQRGGVSGVGPVPGELPSILAGPVGVSYGAQAIGPTTVAPAQLARGFVTACNDGQSSEGEDLEPLPPSGSPTSACLKQGEAALPANRLRAIGTEPFWAARIEGRCVTYSTPENQSGTRIWTSFTGSRDRGEWTGYYDKRRFILRTMPDPDCSDGMSDRRYPVAVVLTVGGEQRRGCAAPSDSALWQGER